ncbi:MAG: hypothetical protein M3O70_06160, partial [Actinomycetota bacterium]|nr:hypothetical protein [Actinomycetota bacterium]
GGLLLLRHRFAGATAVGDALSIQAVGRQHSGGRFARDTRGQSSTQGQSDLTDSVGSPVPGVRLETLATAEVLLTADDRASEYGSTRGNDLNLTSA